MARSKKAPEVEPATEEVAEAPATEPAPEVEAPEAEPTPGEVSETPTTQPDSEVDAPEVEPATEEEGEYRYETYEAVRPDGTVVEIVRNLDTGEQTVTEKQ